MRFNGGTPARQRQHLLVVEHGTRPFGVGGVHVHRRALLVQHHLDALGANRAVEDRGHRGVTKQRFKYAPLIGGHGALHHVLAKAKRAVDHHEIAEARFGVECEGHTGRSAVGSHHVLHRHRQCDFQVGEAMHGAIGNGAIGVQRRKAATHRLQQRIHADHIQERLLLSGEAGIGEIFGCGRAAHGNGCLVESATPVQLRVGGANGRCQFIGEGTPRDGGADALPHLGQRSPGVEAGKLRLHEGLEGIMGQKVPVGVGGDRESPRHADTRAGEVADHLAKRGGLPTHGWYVGARNVFEPAEHDTSIQGTGKYSRSGRY